MLAPLSWLKEYVTITLPPKELGDRLTEIGLGCEKIIKEGNETIFELEITPNRPDCLSLIGVAREIAALEKTKIKFPPLRQGFAGQAKSFLPLSIKTDAKINPRFTGIIIKNITVKESPVWLKKRLESIGQRSINNIVDITNFVMQELGNPLHTFDYDEIKGHTMHVAQAKGGEAFKSVDGLSYHLPKGAVIIKDNERIIDLCGIKGGYNSGTFEKTKNIFIRVPVEVPSFIRRTSQSLGLRSDASSIFERGVNRDGTIEALNRCVDLILELAGGEVASKLYDIKDQDFKPWKLDIRIERLNNILGLEIPEKKVLDILESLNLNPIITKNSKLTIQCLIPTYRNDLQIEEDLIEEVARIYGYNNFPKTLPSGQITTQQIPYFKEYRIDEKVKNILTAAGFSEVYTYSLISEKDVADADRNPDHAIRVDNPVSREFEYLRPTLQTNLVKALKQNEPNFSDVNLFELGKTYKGNSLKDVKEAYVLSGISNQKSFLEIKGILTKIYNMFSVEKNPSDDMTILDDGIFFEINYYELLKNLKPDFYKKFKPIPKYPPIVEDIALIASEDITTETIIGEIKKQSALIVHVDLLDQYQDSRTFHIVYQHRERNLTGEEIKKIREKIIDTLKRKHNARIKE